MKKLFLIVLACIMLTSFVACNVEDSKESTASDGTSVSSERNNNEKDKEDITVTDKNQSDKKEGSDLKESTEKENSEEKISNGTIRLSVVSSVYDSGLMNYILPAFEEKTGYKVEVTYASAGIVAGNVKSGSADVVILDSESREKELITGGFVLSEKTPFAVDYYVICGPEKDTAGVAEAETAVKAFKSISISESDFVSRGDNSVVHNKETGIWESANTDPTNESWYKTAKADMKTTLKEANRSKAYVLAEKSVYLSMKKDLKKLVILKDKTQDLMTEYNLLIVNPKANVFKDADINSKGAKALSKWFSSKEAKKLIENFGLEEYGESLYNVK